MNCEDFGDPTGKYHLVVAEKAKFVVTTKHDVHYHLCYPCLGSFVEYMADDHYPITISIVE